MSRITSYGRNSCRTASPLTRETRNLIVRRSVRLGAGLLVPLVLSVSLAAEAGQGATGTTRTESVKPGGHAPSAVTSSGVMQLKKLIAGDFSYRFVSSGDKTGASATAPVPLPTPPGPDNIVAIPIPASAGAAGGQLEVLDNGRGNVARLPSRTKGVADLTESGFAYAQRVNVPVQARGLGVVGAQVAMTDATRKFTQTRLLQPDDNGVARFDAVPLNDPITVTVSFGANPPESQTKTLTATRPPEAWPAIVVTWPDAKTVAAPPVVSPAPAFDSASRDPDRGRRAVEDDGRPLRQPEGNPLNSMVSTVVSLLFLGAVCYAIFYAYKTGRLKTLLDRLGINAEPVAAGAGGFPDPFSKNARTPIQPLTEGTADPFSGGAPLP